MPNLQEKPHEHVPAPVPVFPKPPGHAALIPAASIPASVSCRRATSPLSPSDTWGCHDVGSPFPLYGVPGVQGVLIPPVLWGSLLQRGSQDAAGPYPPPHYIGVSHPSFYRSPHCRGYPHPSHSIGVPTLQGVPCHMRGSRSL